MDSFEIKIVILIVFFVSLFIFIGVVSTKRNEKCEELGGVLIDNHCISNLEQIEL